MPSSTLDRAAIATLVNEFYDEVRRDAELFPLFNQAIGANWGPHLERMVDFWSTVMLGSRDFQGNVFGKHMLLGGVQPEHFRRWLALFEAATGRLFAPEVAAEFMTVARRIGGSLQYGFFGKLEVA
ncbi:MULTISPECIES: group III truncated hemoglobin [Rugamonas]|uniref:Hemoglobin n=1 Tax=Rugamonas rubra TaxID=758825 RepID=A0A1I4V1Z1_9BURK|nr:MULTISPECIES: group III truncated hemoglobin [Rugamonas]WGG53240.1 group III truncated hemoglobin [Rugamonas sp. DEMB1]SFM95239.1 hemoglobin [Rugamonas rubra]